MICPDTSVLVAGFVPDHPFHGIAAQRLVRVRDGGRLVAHTTAEAYAVLTVPLGPYRAEPSAVLAYLAQFSHRPPAALEGADYLEHLRSLGGEGVVGGAVYDALIALTAKKAGAVLVSLDRRAARTYRSCDVEVELLV